ncbi:alternative ribosome rescue aminoacyl-tRNA hydrolase ArfB [Pedobacter alpinus]|uniref:Alternative ribosome rescue aminoacyl-tRNA hydrolase ArfB n=1 Tax=Pedobacter alpinus TaxID=1590643 RepID=A0ABW5TWH2_9SPHI
MANLALIMNINKDLLEKEFSFKTSRSGGKGGQNVNKVETKVELIWHFSTSALFTDEEKERIALNLSNRISKEKIFSVTAEEDRSQLRNKEIAIKKAFYLIAKSLELVAERKKSKPSYASVKKRLEGKRKQALKKINRNNSFD